MNIFVNKYLKKLIQNHGLMLGKQNSLKRLEQILSEQLITLIDAIENEAKQMKKTIIYQSLLEKVFKTNIQEGDDLELSKIFLSSSIANEIRKRKLMVASGEESPLPFVKVLLSRFLQNLVNKIAHVVKDLASKTIIKIEHIQAGYNMV